MTKIDQLQKFLDKWIPLLGLYDWFLTIIYNTGCWRYDNTDDPITHATTQVKWDQKRFRIDFWMPAIDNHALANPNEIDFLEYVVVHELCHVLVAFMQSDKETPAEHRLTELTTTTLAQAFLRIDGQ